MKFEEVQTPHTLGGWSYILILYINSDKEVVSHLEVELYKPRRYISLATDSRIHVDTLFSWRIQPEAGFGCDNQWTCVHVWTSNKGTGRIRSCENYLGCHIHVDALVSRRVQLESGFGSDNLWTCVHVWASSICTGRVWASERYLGCHIRVDTLVSRCIQPEAGFGSDNQWTCVHVWAIACDWVAKPEEPVCVTVRERERRSMGRERQKDEFILKK